MNVSIVDYGSGNLFSVSRAVEKAGGIPIMASTASSIACAERLILPGVGAFAEGILGLRERGLIDPIQRYAESGRPLLGICLGMQMLATSGEEFGEHLGLNILPGRVISIPNLDISGKLLKIPNIGWVELQASQKSNWQETILDNIQEQISVYLVHSYHMIPENSNYKIAHYNYGGHNITAAVQSGKVVGCQFHPEKSGELGISIISNFLRL